MCVRKCEVASVRVSTFCYLPKDEWETTLKNLLQHALSPVSIYEFDDTISLVDISLMLHKLIEATHLIEVRAIVKDENGPRPKWSNNKQLEKLEESKDDKNENYTIVELVHEHIKEFFQFFGEQGAREELWSMLKRSLRSQHDEIPARDLSNMIFVYEQVVELIDDIYTLHMQQQISSK